jgi:vitamin B12 transporter
MNRRFAGSIITVIIGGGLVVGLCRSCPAQDEIVADSIGVVSDSTAARVVASEESLRVHRVDEVLVTASRLGAARSLNFSNVAVATKLDLGELSSSTSAEALATDPGIGLTRYGSYGALQTLSLRGGSSSEVVYLLDGVPISDPQLASIDLNWLPLSGTDRVEAMKGGASAIYGSGAIGGAVNLVSEDALTAMPSSEINAWRGSFGSQVVGANLRRSFGGRVGVLGAYDNTKSDGSTGATGYRGEKFYGKVSGLVGRAATVDLVGFNYSGALDLTGSCPCSRQSVQKDKRSFIKVSLASISENGFNVDWYRSHSNQRYQYDYSLSTAEGCQEATSKSDGTLDGLRAGAYKRFGADAVSSLGAGYERRRLESNSVGTKAAHDYYASFQQELRMGRLTLVGGSRLEKNSQFRLEAAPQAAAWFLPGRGLSLFAKLDRSFMYPTFNDLYWKDLMATGNPNLKTEHSTGAELGLSIRRGPLEVASTVYYRRAGDMILWRTAPGCNYVMSTNTEARLRGLEVSCKITPIGGVEALLSYWVGRATDAEGRRFEYRPSNALTWTLRTGRSFSKHVSGGIVLAGRTVPRTATGDQLDITWFHGQDDSCGFACRSGTSLPPYTSATGYAYLSIDRARVFARANNLLSDHIVPTWGMPALPARSYELGVSWELVD